MLLLGARAHKDHPHTGVFVGHGQSHDIPIESLFLLEVVNVESYVSELCNRRRGHLSSLRFVFRHDAVARWKPYFRTIALKLLDVQPPTTGRSRLSRGQYISPERPAMPEITPTNCGGIAGSCLLAKRSYWGETISTLKAFSTCPMAPLNLM